MSEMRLHEVGVQIIMASIPSQRRASWLDNNFCHHQPGRRRMHQIKLSWPVQLLLRVVEYASNCPDRWRNVLRICTINDKLSSLGVAININLILGADFKHISAQVCVQKYSEGWQPQKDLQGISAWFEKGTSAVCLRNTRRSA